MKYITILSIALTTIGLHSIIAETEKIPGKDFNGYILRILQTYPTNGTHQYYWPSKSSWAGNTRNLYYQGKLFSKGDHKKRCYCCGLTFEVFFRAYELYCLEKGWPFTIKNFNSKQLLNFRKQWFGSDGNKKTHYNAIIANGLGKSITFKQAQPGDFVQFWRHNGSGHSVIFLSWIRDSSQNIIGIQYWSTQRSTNGINYHTEYIKKKSGIDISRIYIARVGK